MRRSRPSPIQQVLRQRRLRRHVKTDCEQQGAEQHEHDDDGAAPIGRARLPLLLERGRQAQRDRRLVTQWTLHRGKPHARTSRRRAPTIAAKAASTSRMMPSPR